ncbi:HNH endonuclease [Promicromonospora sukumoe]|uniref:HNH endonuclease n=1 Tax=Promicromonospora sukumoe TaxID=88382 RepID=UPI000A014176|nr:HNH endonuclease [Promicromonospora sukumoe]
MILPGATDIESGSAGVPGAVQAEWVDLLGELEAVKNAITATQARLTVALDETTRADEARQSIRSERRGRGVPNQVAAALRVSPHAGAGFVSTSRVWVTQMPHTFAALQAGVLSQWRATLLVRETSHLSLEHRALIDEEICGPAHLAELARMSTRRLIARIKELAAQLDVHACVKRNAKAVSERRVSIRPAPDLMVYLTALVPMAQGVQAYAQLKATADATKATGDERGVGQIMADTLIERVTTREPGQANDVPVTINLLVSDDTLLAGGNQPAIVVEGAPAGAGVVPAPVARNLAAHAIDTDTAWLRSIYVNPHGRLLATTSTSRFHPQGLAALLRAREQGICATAWCDAPIRHTDHVTPHAEGGATSLDNGQGLCARCNHAKQAPGWSQKSTQLNGLHAVETVTPTGHTYVSVAPTPPTPARTGNTTPRRDVSSVHEASSVRATGIANEVTPVAGSNELGDGNTLADRPAPVADSETPGDTPATAASGPPLDPDQAENPATAALASATGEPDHVPDPTPTRDRTATPPWTPAVGMTGPAPGHTPRSRYSIGCQTTPGHGTIPYRPSPPPRQPSPAPQPLLRPASRVPGRARARSSRPDLSWTHPA